MFCVQTITFQVYFNPFWIGKIITDSKAFSLIQCPELEKKKKPLCSLASLACLVIRKYFPDDSIDFKSIWKSADNYWKVGTGDKLLRGLHFSVLAVRCVCGWGNGGIIKSKMWDGSFLFQTQAVSTFAVCYRSSFPSAKQRAAPSECRPAAGLRGSVFIEPQRSPDSVLLPKQSCSGEHLPRVWGIWRILEQSRDDPLTLIYSLAFLFPFFFCKVPLMSVWGGPPVCVLVSQWCSTRASAGPDPFSVWLGALEEIDASVHIPVGWSCRWERSRICCRVRGGGGPGRAPCRCPASSLVFWSWLTFWTSWFGCWWQCWIKERGTIEDYTNVLLFWGGGGAFTDWLKSLGVGSHLECGSKVSLMSSGLTKFCDVVPTDGLSRALFLLLPSHELNLREEI